MVYIDDLNAPFRNMIMCHMVADASEELLEMVDKIGVQRIQDVGTYQEHFDISLEKKKLALSFGVKEIGWREMGKFTSAKKTGELYKPQEKKPTLF